MLVAHGAVPEPLPAAEQFEAAVLAGDRDAARALLGDGPRDPALVSRAIESGRGDAVRLLHELGFPIVRSPRHPLHDAAWRGDLALVKLLIELGADPDELEPQYNKTPLGWAQHNHQQAVIDFLEPLTTASAGRRGATAAAERSLPGAARARRSTAPRDGASPRPTAHCACAQARTPHVRRAERLRSGAQSFVCRFTDLGGLRIRISGR